MNQEIQAYNNTQLQHDAGICDLLALAIDKYLTEATSKIWHGHPVWFLNENPIVGYNKQKSGICLLFWSGQSFEETTLKPKGKFKAADIKYTKIEEINMIDLERCFNKAKIIQWDYKNIIKRKGQLERLK